MLISRLLESIDVQIETEDREVEFITDNSEKCTEKSIFVCHEGAEQYVDSALSKGAVLVVAEKKLCDTCVVVENTRRAYSMLCAAFFDNSYRKLRLIGVTGTNGKTTVSSMLYHILSCSGKKCALIGTAGYLHCDEEKAASLTTPDPFELHKMFYGMTVCNTEFCIIEASSQGLVQERLYPLEFEVSVFTNLSADHLDYHGDMDSYLKAKEILFRNSKKSVINADDNVFERIKEASEGKVITYSLKKDEADFTAKYIRFYEGVTDYVIVAEDLIHRVRLQTPGNYNIYNSMAAIVTAMECGVEIPESANALRNFYGVKGRFEVLPLNKDFRVIIDYAHSPDSLKQVLLSLSSFPKNRVITLFGCGGNRDKSKRGEMGRVAAFYSDMVILTSDNPRNENPSEIIDDIIEGIGVTRTPVYIIENRRKAIEYALQKAQKNDIILLAGKGHETYQIIGEEKLPFDERKIVSSLLS